MNESTVDTESGPEKTDNKVPGSDVDALVRLLGEIGVARFAGRISAGLIEEAAGYQAIEQFVKADIHRPLFSKLSQALLRRPNSYDPD